MKTLYLYRMHNGQRVRVTFELDEQMTILKETISSPTPITPPTLDPQHEALRQRGVIVEGNLITHIPDKEQQLFRFFGKETPCWFDGCEELRAQYAAEIANLGDTCPTCMQGAIIRKYRDKVEEMTRGK